MKTYKIPVNLNFAVCVSVDAESEKEALSKAGIGVSSAFIRKLEDELMGGAGDSVVYVDVFDYETQTLVTQIEVED